MRQPDYISEHNLFDQYDDGDRLFDEQDEEVGIEDSDAVSSQTDAPRTNSKLESPPIEDKRIPTKKQKLPDSLRNKGVLKAHLLLKDGSILILE